MNKEEILSMIKQKIENNTNFQPILFLWENKLLEPTLEYIISNLFSHFEVDKNSIYKLLDDWNSLKISNVREFVLKWNVKSSYRFQIFVIENIQRLTLESSNSLLKFLEEPWVWNIIFLTSNSSSMILDTILSRVLSIDLRWNKVFEKNEFYLNLIDDYINKKNANLLKYFFDDKKLEKTDYITFFENFIYYIKTNLVYTDLLENIEESINLINKNNVLPKYEIDKILIKLN